jgi:hypothetical protein
MAIAMNDPRQRGVIDIGLGLVTKWYCHFPSHLDLETIVTQTGPSGIIVGDGAIAGERNHRSFHGSA